MAFIEAFHIEGLAGHSAAISRNLNRTVNVFWGLNGTGKTSLLRILNAALDNDTSSLERTPFHRAQVVIRSNSRSVLRSYDKGQVSDEEIARYEYSEDSEELSWAKMRRASEAPKWETTVISGTPTDRTSVRFSHVFLPISRVSQGRGIYGNGFRLSSTERQGFDDAAFDELFADQVRRSWQIYSNNALSSIREIQQTGLASILSVLFGGAGITADSPSTTADEAYSLVRDFLRDQQITLSVGKTEFIKRYEKESDLRSVVANIQGVTAEVENALAPQNQFQAIIEDLYSGNKHLVFNSQTPNSRNNLQVQIDGVSIPLQSLSSGEKQLLQLLLETLAADSNVVMIDEPELSMHVDWQQNLVAAMTAINPNCQLLLATHSPEILAELPSDFVFEL